MGNNVYFIDGKRNQRRRKREKVLSIQTYDNVHTRIKHKKKKKLNFILKASRKILVV